MMSIPLIDLSGFENSHQSTKIALAKQIYQACHDIGFMYIHNSVISTEFLAETFRISKAFFNSSLAVKQQLAWCDELVNTGYVGIEREHLNINRPGDLKEAFNISHQDIFNPPSSPFSPAKNSIIITFYQACTKLANTVLQALALALELPEDFFAIKHNQTNHTLRLLHYPPLHTTSLKPGQVRAGEHSDYGSLTLLFQDGVAGLEVQTTSGHWMTAPPIPGTVVVNTGDLMQRWTNHIFCSTKHRVMIPHDEKVKQSRYSIAFFCHPNDDTEITCLENCCQQQPPIYPPILAGEYLINRLQATY